MKDTYELNVTVDDREHVHPSQQAIDYAGSLSNIHSSFTDGRLTARSCSYCHNLKPKDTAALLSSQFQTLLEHSPLFTAGGETLFANHLLSQVGGGDGTNLMEQYVTGHFRPGKKLLEIVDATISGNDQWYLIGRQREAYNHILSHVRRSVTGKGRSAPSSSGAGRGPGRV